MKALMAILALLLVLAGVLALFLMGQYNGLVRDEQQVANQWANVETAYQRRADLIPNLVATVKGAAEFEQETLNEVIEARSRVGAISGEAAAEALSDPQAFARFEAAQASLTSALQRLLVVVERYPELKAVAAFQDLLVQLEGTENRISVARTRFNEAARAFNTRLKSVPTAWLVSWLGWPFEEKAFFAATTEGAEEAPAVEF